MPEPEVIISDPFSPILVNSRTVENPLVNRFIPRKYEITFKFNSGSKRIIYKFIAIYNIKIDIIIPKY